MLALTPGPGGGGYQRRRGGGGGSWGERHARGPEIRSPSHLRCRLIDKKGLSSEGDPQAFSDSGYVRPIVLDTVVTLAMKTLSNCINHKAEPSTGRSATISTPAIRSADP